MTSVIFCGILYQNLDTIIKSNFFKRYANPPHNTSIWDDQMVNDTKLTHLFAYNVPRTLLLLHLTKLAASPQLSIA